MNQQSEVLRRLATVMSAVLDVRAEDITDVDSTATIATWDSVGHLQLMMALEEEFQVQFEANELASLSSVALLLDRLRGSRTAA